MGDGWALGPDEDVMNLFITLSHLFFFTDTFLTFLSVVTNLSAHPSSLPINCPKTTTVLAEDEHFYNLGMFQIQTRT